MDLAQLKQHLNSEPVKYGILFLSSPIWLPFVKALWRALNDALRDEGGILGNTPTAAELRALEREQAGDTGVQQVSHGGIPGIAARRRRT